MFGLDIVQWSLKVRTGPAQWLAEAVATAGLLFVIFRAPAGKAPVLVACYIGAAYWFTASTSFANPAAVFGRMMSNTFAGISPADATGFVLAQLVGAGLGESARAALMTRGYAEMTRFAVALGGRAETLAGLSGFGDLVLTCSSTQSRNFSFGLALGRGEAVPEKLAEGALTAPVLLDLAEKLHVDMPIAHAVADILAGRISVDAAIGVLLARPQKAEG
jgi:hypothetical protein